LARSSAPRRMMEQHTPTAEIERKAVGSFAHCNTGFQPVDRGTRRFRSVRRANQQELSDLLWRTFPLRRLIAKLLLTGRSTGQSCGYTTHGLGSSCYKNASPWRTHRITGFQPVGCGTPQLWPVLRPTRKSLAIFLRAN
jgi:hypothetical protein